MSNTTKFRSADEQCAEYVTGKRRRITAQQADRELEVYLVAMRRQFGLEPTLGALVRYVGLMMLESSRSSLLRVCRRYLMKCIIKGVLTGARIIH